MWRIEQHIPRALLRKHFPRPDQVRLLDFACGTVRILRLPEHDVGSATGVDVAQSMLDVAGKGVDKARLLCADIIGDDVLDNERVKVVPLDGWRSHLLWVRGKRLREFAQTFGPLGACMGQSEPDVMIAADRFANLTALEARQQAGRPLPLIHRTAHPFVGLSRRAFQGCGSP